MSAVLVLTVGVVVFLALAWWEVALNREASRRDLHGQALDMLRNANWQLHGGALKRFLETATEAQRLDGRKVWISEETSEEEVRRYFAYLDKLALSAGR